MRAQGVSTDRFPAIGATHSPSTSVSEVRVAGDPDPVWKTYPVHGMEPGFIDGGALLFGQRAKGYETDAAILDAIRTQPNVAIADAFAIPADDDFGGMRMPSR